MLIGIFSDIHSNIQALEAVLDSMARRGVKRRVCLGDLVGYCADAEACVRRIREVADVCIMGNHDSVALNMESDRNFNRYAREAIEKTRSQLSLDSVEYLRRLPYQVEEGDLQFVHASPRSPADWGYVSSIDDAIESFGFHTQRICFIGHTHTPVIVVRQSNGDFRVLDQVRYRPTVDERLLVNVGSVGQPRDRDPRASWCQVDPETLEVEIVRVPYDIAGAQRRMRAQDFPPFLVQRLEEGR